MKSFASLPSPCGVAGDRPGWLGACAEHGGKTGCAGAVHRHADRQGLDACLELLDARQPTDPSHPVEPRVQSAQPDGEHSRA